MKVVPGIVSADAVAAAILRGLRKRQETVYIPRTGAFFRLFENVTPILMDVCLSRLTEGRA